MKTNATRELTTVQRKRLGFQNTAREAAGLSLITVKKRKCILCKSVFESTGNRTCQGCQDVRREASSSIQ